MENKNNGLTIVVIILTLLVIGLGGYIVYDKVLSNKDDNSIEENDNNKTMKAEDYITVEEIGYEGVKKVSFKNLDTSLIQNFLNDQNTLINKLDKTNNCTDCTSHTDTSDIWYQINDNILTVYYKLTYAQEIGICTEVLTINIDLVNNKTLSNEDVLKLANYSFDDIALKEYNETLNEIKEGKKITDADYNEITEKEFIDNKNKYTNDIINGLEDAIVVYIQDGVVKYDYSFYAIDILYIGVGKSGCFPYVTETVGNLK